MKKPLILEKYITKAVKKALQEQEDQIKRTEKAMYFIHRFPGLKKTLIELMSPAFGRYVADISLISPKPTTFNIELINKQDFILYYIGKGNFTVKVAGKRYNPNNIGELERASQSITDLLELNYAPTETKEEASSVRDANIKADLENPSFGSSEPGNFPGNEKIITPEETPETIPTETPEEEETVEI